MKASSLRSAALLALGGGLTAAGPALAGPPFVTDDPEPVEYHGFEINSAYQETDARQIRNGTGPLFDINYGVLPDVQAHVGVAMSFYQGPGQHLAYGYADTEVGVKYRFVEEDAHGWRPQIALYPNLEIPTGNAALGLGAGYTRAFLPLWVQKSFGDWTAYGGGGYWLNRHDDNRNYWFSGVVVQRKITERLSLGPELFHLTANTVGGASSAAIVDTNGKAATGFNFGGSYQISEGSALLFSAGRGLQDVAATNTFSTYLAYQLTF